MPKNINNFQCSLEPQFFYFGSLVHNSDMLSKITVFLPADGTGRPVLVMDIVNVPLQVRLEIAAVSTLSAFKIFNLEQKN